MGASIKITYTRALAVDVSGGNQTMFQDAGMPHADAFLIGTAGNLVIDTPGGDIRVTVPVVAGWNPVAAVKVYQSGTTASGVTALY